MRFLRTRCVGAVVVASLVACRKHVTTDSRAGSIQLGRVSCQADSLLAFLPVDQASITSEREAIDSARQPIRRNGDTLRIPLRNGTDALLRDCRREGDDFVKFRYLGYVQRLRSHLVDVSYYEGGGYVLMADSIGRHIWLPSPPTFAPDSARFLVSSIDLEANYDPNVLEIWLLGNDSVSLEFKVDGDRKWGPAEPHWTSPTVIQFWKTTINGTDLSRDSTLATIQWRDGSWRVIDAGSP